jgi:hypothetical protein
MVQATGDSTLACDNGVSIKNNVSSGLEWSKTRVVCKTKREIETVIRFDGQLKINSNGNKHNDLWDIENATISCDGFVDLKFVKEKVNANGNMILGRYPDEKMKDSIAYEASGRI